MSGMKFSLTTSGRQELGLTCNLNRVLKISYDYRYEEGCSQTALLVYTSVPSTQKFSRGLLRLHVGPNSLQLDIGPHDAVSRPCPPCRIVNPSCYCP